MRLEPVRRKTARWGTRRARCRSSIRIPGWPRSCGPGLPSCSGRGCRDQSASRRRTRPACTLCRRGGEDSACCPSHGTSQRRADPRHIRSHDLLPGRCQSQSAIEACIRGNPSRYRPDQPGSTLPPGQTIHSWLTKPGRGRPWQGSRQGPQSSSNAQRRLWQAWISALLVA